MPRDGFGSPAENSNSEVRVRNMRYKKDHVGNRCRSDRSSRSPRKQQHRGRHNSMEDSDFGGRHKERKYKGESGSQCHESDEGRGSESSDDGFVLGGRQEDSIIKDDKRHNGGQRLESPQPWLDRTVKENEEKEEKPQPPVKQMEDGIAIRSGGIYIPPHRMAQMMRDVQDKSSEAYQRLSWDALRKSINGLVNKVNATNTKNIIPELLSKNLIKEGASFAGLA